MSLGIYQKSSGLFLALVLGVAVAACGGNQQAQTNTAPTAMSEAQREQAALPLAQMAPIPRGLKCRSPIVWVNLKTKAYHEKGDPYYGRTKNGQYMCQAAADAAGDHMAGSKSSMENTSGSMSGTGTKHHRKRANENMYTPAPMAT